MAFPKVHNYLVVHGDTNNGGSPDVWQFGLRFNPPGDGLAVADDAFLTSITDDIKSDVQTWWSAMGTMFPSTTRLIGIKFNAIGTDGLYVSQEKTVESDYATPLAGGGGTAKALPSQVAVAVTLHTDSARGYAHKGRFYLPPITVGCVGTGGLIEEQFRDDMQLHAKTLLDNLNNWPGIDSAGDPGDVSVFSNVGAGAVKKVTGVSVGKRFDTMRSRANRVVEFRDPLTLLA